MMALITSGCVLGVQELERLCEEWKNRCMGWKRNCMEAVRDPTTWTILQKMTLITGATRSLSTK